jgi:hypothetical protein
MSEVPVEAYNNKTYERECEKTMNRFYFLILENPVQVAKIFNILL